MTKTAFTLPVLAFALLAGCASNGSYKDRDYTALTAFPSKTAQFPSVGNEAEAEPGKSMLSSSRLAMVPALQLDQDLHHQGKYSDNYESRITVPAGALLASGKDEHGTFYESSRPLSFAYFHIRTQKITDSEQLKGGIYVPTDSAQAPEVYWYWEGEATPASSPHPGLPYKLLTTEYVGKDGFKRELVYSGVYQNTLAIVYREYKEDTTRPVYLQDLKYDLSRGNLIAYQGARFEVIKADNTKVRYKVLNPLD